MKTLALSLLTGTAITLTACGGHTPQQQGANTPTAGARTSSATRPHPAAIRQLTNIAQLQAQFNQQPNVPKLIVLMSPT
jgi:hypothetical protein